MVRTIVGARQVKFLSGLAGGQGQDALAEARCAGFASRRLARGCSWRPPTSSAGCRSLYFCRGSRSGPPPRWRLVDTRQYALGRLEIDQLSGDLCAIGIEDPEKSLSDNNS